MHDFKRTNKISGVHWLKEPIDNLRISVKMKPHNGILSLPKFENYTNVSNGINSDSFEQTEEYTFKWQEKAFSLWEIQRYSDVHHCITDTELTYHNMLNDLDYEPVKVFTYVHDDYHLPLPLNNVKSKRNKIMDLSTCFERLNLNDRIEKALVKESSSMGHLFRSEENLDVDNKEWRAMHIAFDSSDYNEDSQLVFKQEAILVSVYHNITHNYLLVSPDENQLELNPYCAETSAGVPLGYHYAIGLRFEDAGDSEELTVLLNKLHKKWEKKHKQLVNFCMPSLGRKIYHLTLEILTAKEFEMDDLYVEYTIKIPDAIKCTEPVHGRTHVTRALRVEDTEEWCFGHIIELHLEADAVTGIEPSPLQIFFEVISTDWWGRHRTEGYSYLALPLRPGSHSKLLSCSRPDEWDRVEAGSRRFFVGGCNLIKDLDVLANPQLQNANFVFTTTGSIFIRWHTLAQSPLPGYSLPGPTVGRSASAVLLGAEAVLRQYRRARARLAAATRDLRHDGSGDAPSLED
ncbi:Meckel syndrome type 1 protein [Ostrinia furnacalis]|uniref:Meckel syndrome type 1 protein n=1 Tax=Ostrinia furnacalis TaxID=93504 RepID=UPI00103ED057|nr:Meckel syndrome type 1 protein [Ostrinia furnacalis]